MESEADLREAIACGADVIMLDNQDLESLQRLVQCGARAGPRGGAGGFRWRDSGERACGGRDRGRPYLHQRSDHGGACGDVGLTLLRIPEALRTTSPDDRTDVLERCSRDAIRGGEEDSDAAGGRCRQHPDRSGALLRQGTRPAIGASPPMSEKTGDEIAVLLDGLLRLDGFSRESVSGLAVASVVPRLSNEYASMAARKFGLEALVVGPGVKTGMPVLTSDPRQVGPDLIVDAVAAHDAYGAPCIAVDFGTATTFSAVSAAGEYLGHAIAPGIEVSLDALATRAARLLTRSNWRTRAR